MFISTKLGTSKHKVSFFSDCSAGHKRALLPDIRSKFKVGYFIINTTVVCMLRKAGNVVEV